MPQKCRRKVKVKNSKSKASHARKRRLKFPSEKVVSLNLAKCANDSLSCLLNRIHIAMRNSKNRITETKDKEEDDSTIPSRSEIPKSSSFTTLQTSETTYSQKERLRKFKKKRQKQHMTLGKIFLMDFKFFAKFGDKKAKGSRMSYPKTLRWLKKAEILEHRRVTIHDVEVHFINALRSGYELRILEFIRFLKSLCEDRGLEMSTVLKKLLSCRKNRPIIQKSTISKKKVFRKCKQKYSLKTQVTSNISMRKKSSAKQFSRFSIQNEVFQEKSFDLMGSQDNGESVKGYMHINEDEYTSATPIRKSNLENIISVDAKNNPLHGKQSLTLIKSNPCETDKSWEDLHYLCNKLPNENFIDYFNAEVLKLKIKRASKKNPLISGISYRNNRQRQNVDIRNIKVIGRELAFYEDDKEENYEFIHSEPSTEILYSPLKVINQGCQSHESIHGDKIIEKPTFLNDTTIKLNGTPDEELRRNPNKKVVISAEDTSAIIYVQYFNEENATKDIYSSNQANNIKTASNSRNFTHKHFHKDLQQEPEMAPRASQSITKSTYLSHKTRSPYVQTEYNTQKNTSPDKMDKSTSLNYTMKSQCTEKLRYANESILSSPMKAHKGRVSPRNKSTNTSKFLTSSYKSKTDPTLEKQIEELQEGHSLSKQENKMSDITEASDNPASNCNRSENKKMRTFSNLPVGQVQRGLLKLRNSKIRRKMLKLANSNSEDIKTKSETKATNYKKHTKYDSTNTLKLNTETNHEDGKNKCVSVDDKNGDASNVDFQTQKRPFKSRIFDKNDRKSRTHINKPNANNKTDKKKKHLATDRKRAKSIVTRTKKENIDKNKPTEAQFSLNDDVYKKGKQSHENNSNSIKPKKNGKISKTSNSKPCPDSEAIAKNVKIQPISCIKSKLSDDKSAENEHINKTIKPIEVEYISSEEADYTDCNIKSSACTSKSKWDKNANAQKTARKKKSKCNKRSKSKNQRTTFSNLPVTHVRKALLNLRISERNAQISKSGTSKTKSKAKQQKGKYKAITKGKLSNFINGRMTNMQEDTDTIYKPSTSTSNFDGSDNDAHPSSPEDNVSKMPQTQRIKKYKIRKGVRLTKKELKNPETEIGSQETIIRMKIDANLRL